MSGGEGKYQISRYHALFSINFLDKNENGLRNIASGLTARGGSRGGHHRSGTGAVTTAIPVVAVVVRVILRRNVCSALVPLLVGRRAFLHPLLHRRQLLVLLLLVARHAIRVPLAKTKTLSRT